MVHNPYIRVLLNRKDLAPIGLAKGQQLNLPKAAIVRLIP